MNEQILVDKIKENYLKAEHFNVAEAEPFAVCIRSLLEQTVLLFYVKRYGEYGVYENSLINNPKFTSVFGNFFTSDFKNCRAQCNGIIHDQIHLSVNELGELQKRAYSCIEKVLSEVGVKIVIDKKESLTQKIVSCLKQQPEFTIETKVVFGKGKFLFFCDPRKTDVEQIVVRYHAKDFTITIYNKSSEVKYNEKIVKVNVDMVEDIINEIKEWILKRESENRVAHQSPVKNEKPIRSRDEFVRKLAPRGDIAGWCYSSAKKVYERGCSSFGWDSSQIGKFGMQQKLYADNCTPEGYAVWCVPHSTVFTEPHEPKTSWKNYVYKDRIEEFWQMVPNPTNRIRVVFIKTDIGYRFAGVYELKETKKTGLDSSFPYVRTYKRISDIYPCEE